MRVIAIVTEPNLIARILDHLRRRDHWVRLVELIASVLHWWSPLVWWVRRRLHLVEEQCCDAWAKWAFPDRSRDYAECLLKVAELSSHPPLPIMLASPFLHASGLKERIEMVLKNRPRRSVSRWGAICLAVLAAAVVPIGVQSVQGESDEAGAAVTETAPPHTDAAKVATVARKSAAAARNMSLRSNVGSLTSGGASGARRDITLVSKSASAMAACPRSRTRRRKIGDR